MVLGRDFVTVHADSRLDQIHYPEVRDRDVARGGRWRFKFAEARVISGGSAAMQHQSHECSPNSKTPLLLKHTKETAARAGQAATSCYCEKREYSVGKPYF